MIKSQFNGAESPVRTLVASGVVVCFANPGTSEIHFVDALDRVEGMCPVLALFEGVVTGCAEGNARMLRRPAATLLHLGPGQANLHYARRAASPIVNIVGDPATYHAHYDAPLSSDVAASPGPSRPGCMRASTRARWAPRPPAPCRRPGPRRARSPP